MARPLEYIRSKRTQAVLGNEYADEAAKRATELLADDRTSQQPVACAADAAPPYTDMYWPVIASSSQLQDDDEHGKRGPVWLNDIHGALKRHLHPIHKLGHSNTDSLYYKMWQKTLSDVDRHTYQQRISEQCQADTHGCTSDIPSQVWPIKHSQPKVQMWAGAK